MVRGRKASISIHGIVKQTTFNGNANYPRDIRDHHQCNYHSSCPMKCQGLGLRCRQRQKERNKSSFMILRFIWGNYWGRSSYSDTCHLFIPVFWGKNTSYQKCVLLLLFSLLLLLGRWISFACWVLRRSHFFIPSFWSFDGRIFPINMSCCCRFHFCCLYIGDEFPPSIE